MNQADILQLVDNPLEHLSNGHNEKDIECIESMRLSVATTSTVTLMWTSAQRDYSYYYSSLAPGLKIQKLFCSKSIVHFNR